MNQQTTHKMAESLSLALNPFLLLPLVFLIAIFSTTFPSTTTQSRWLGVVLVSNFLLPLWLIFFLDQRGVVLDDTLANKKLHRQRLIALLPIMIIILLEITIMKINTVHEPLFAVLLSSFTVTAIGGIISYYWKISAHTMGLSMSITLLTLLLGPWALIGAVSIPFLAWSRLVLHRHTPTQLLTGIILPPLIILAIFVWLKLY